MYKLIIEDDEGKTTIVPLIRNQITIGRGEGNAIRLNERNVSRSHARLVVEDGIIRVEDTNSYNGIFLNGEMIDTQAEVKMGDLVEIGDYHLSIRDASQDEEVEARPSAPPKKSSGEGTPPTDIPAVSGERALSLQDVRLIVMSTSLAGKRFPMKKDKVTIGRTDDNDIYIDHVSVSRAHAELSFQNGTFQIRDLGSANGVRVNGEDFERCDLRLGDIIELGHVRIRFASSSESNQVELNFTDDPEEIIASVVAGEGQQSSRWMVLAGVVTGMLLVCIIAIIYLLQQGRGSGISGVNPNKRKGPSPIDVRKVPEKRDTKGKFGSDTLFQRAQDFYDKQNYEVSQRLIEEALQKRTDWKEAEELRDKIFFEKKQLRILREAYDLEEKSEWSAAITKLKQVHKTSRYAAKAEKDRQRLVPRAINALMQKLKVAMAEKRPNEAIQYSAAILEMDPEYTEAQEIHKTLQQQLGQEPKERPEPREEPKEPKKRPPVKRKRRISLKQLCALHQKRERYKKALECYQRLQAKEPDFTKVYLFIADIYDKMGNCDASPSDPSYNLYNCADAEHNYKKFLFKEPKSPDAMRIRKMIANRRKRRMKSPAARRAPARRPAPRRDAPAPR
ncbi:MAG: FHA domain-containing protein [Myxococcales bacterium]|nr:FHA domain-containing protein [Myxococcales bacterium]